MMQLPQAVRPAQYASAPQQTVAATRLPLQVYGMTPGPSTQTHRRN